MAQKYIGITLPLQLGNTGYFAQSISIFEQVKSNFKNLMMTRKGERLMQPEFGTDLHNIVFNQITEETLDNMKLSVSAAVERWMPFLEVVEITANSPEDGDYNKVLLKVDYRFRSNPNVTDSITVPV
jgi:phage baseplate assembly protein W